MKPVCASEKLKQWTRLNSNWTLATKGFDMHIIHLRYYFPLNVQINFVLPQSNSRLLHQKDQIFTQTHYTRPINKFNSRPLPPKRSNLYTNPIHKSKIQHRGNHKNPKNKTRIKSKWTSATGVNHLRWRRIQVNPSEETCLSDRLNSVATNWTAVGFPLNADSVNASTWKIQSF